ncbi:MAG: RND transporter [Gammaproteobacteria bacterium]|nr:RND transporter [Gammaproteobacteria bacterium]MDH5728042.1 RND transporter [Gammaproteobacteria bacterium]
MKWIDKLPLMPLGIIALFLLIAPISPEPHLWEKLKMLAAGELSKPIDIFDLFMHATPAILFVIRFIREKKGLSAE